MKSGTDHHNITLSVIRHSTSQVLLIVRRVQKDEWGVLTWTFKIRLLQAISDESLQNPPSMRKSDENWRDGDGMSGFSSSFFIHLECWIIKLKWNHEQELGSHKKRKTTTYRPVGRGSEGLSRKWGRGLNSLL
ncbi:hypothetical protein AVEN_149029-1 [Araneus ventricosus]|uniref:Uncharacterized protein n=1 Tax=Araneus ventricosus TaxID=182803 RepID=A0A4Y2UEL0_ARAVE|nr:hypothetical protein AVEN_36411-1 [Araneus ventricosus]GBO10542.1 hypothetical protein AVEN_149029-1 [Araneus ventricosus]